ncbi:MAG TPA: hypothetical protein VMU89_12905 [Thermomicrobiaceae bacterium]|nr:hypothetical protein [Thermomicrobiaceae bacterium]
MRSVSRPRPVTRGLVVVLGLLILALAPACTVERVLRPDLPASDGTLTVARQVSQVFVAPGDGLNRLSIGIVPPNPSSQTPLSTVTGGATVELRYAPQFDPGYPDGDFHTWPADQQWLGELTGSRSVGESFISDYPNLNGITLRVATFGADLSPGVGQLRSGTAAPVLQLPVDGPLLEDLPGGSSVRVDGSAEGYAHVVLDDGTIGYVQLSRFATLPKPTRVNDHDVVLTLYRDGDPTPIRTVTINARDMHDNSHVTFEFASIPDSLGAAYRFTLASSGSVQGNAVTFRYSPTDDYADGTRFEDGKPALGDLIFRPSYADGAALYRGSLDSYVLSGQTNALEGTFHPLANTAGRALEVVVKPGDRPLDVEWSTSRPPGDQPLMLAGDPGASRGGLVLNVGFRDDLPLGSIAGDSLHRVGGTARRDPLFFSLYGLLIAAAAAWFVVSLGRGLRRGR